MIVQSNPGYLRRFGILRSPTSLIPPAAVVATDVLVG